MPADEQMNQKDEQPNTRNKRDAAKPAPAKPEVAPVEEGLVRMVKHGELLDVHPTTVAAHQAVGWEEA